MARKTFAGIKDGIIEPENGDGNNPTIVDGDVGDSGRTNSDADEHDTGIISPGDIIAGVESDSSGAPKRKRGRPRGSTNASGKSSTRKETPSDLSGLLYSLHFMLEKLTGIEEIGIDDGEAKELSKALLRVNALYNDYVIPETVIAWAGLLTAMGGVYGTRIGAYNLRMENERKKKQGQVIEVDWKVAK